ncbi:MAG: hypothetical protein JOZ94_22810 [Xanthobacteraceae bacterium]|nr:hypothetical protein [Xanthobacteraceae bacterium]MBV9631099.1 hypothetical protein [Xanthobacteraceae bacterium]
MVHLRDAGRYFILMIAIAFASHAAQAEVTGIEIASRTDVLGGKVAQKYFLAEDQADIVARAMARWDAVTQGTPLAGK